MALGVLPRAQGCVASWAPGGSGTCPERTWCPGGRLTCLLQRLEAPGHLGDSRVEAAAPVVALLGGDLRVTAVHPVLGRDGTLALRCPDKAQSAASALPAWGWSVGSVWQVCTLFPLPS